MFEPAKNSKAPDFSEALILLGRDGEIIFNDLWEGGLNQKPQPLRGCRPFYGRCTQTPLAARP
jgi:hypothetical protein